MGEAIHNGMVSNATKNNLLKRLTITETLVTVFAILHHIDHIIRGGDHVGWPFNNDVNGFTYSLLIYPPILIAFYMTSRGKLALGYRLSLATAGLLLVAFIHFTPWAADTLQDVYGPYDGNTVAAVLAVAILMGLLGSLVALILETAWA